MITEPAPDHLCVFVCDVQGSRHCLGRSTPIPYGEKGKNGWLVMEGDDEFTICRSCWNDMV